MRVLYRVSNVVFVALLLVVLLSVPWWAVRTRTDRAARHWPERTTHSRVRVEVVGGPFRDGSVQFQAEERVPAGAPKSLKVLCYLAMLFGQLWPLGVVILGVFTITSVRERFFRPTMLGGWNLSVLLLVAVWLSGAWQAWAGSTALLEGDVVAARARIARSGAAYGLALFVAVLCSRIGTLPGGVDWAPWSPGPLLACAAIALAQRILFERHAPALLEAQAQARSTRVAADSPADNRFDADGEAPSGTELDAASQRSSERIQHLAPDELEAAASVRPRTR